jgi:hypothetical protein
VASNQAVAGDVGTSRADALAAHAPDQAWKRRSCGNGAKGPRMFEWAAATLPDDGTEPAGWSRYLLVRRSLTRNAGLIPVTLGEVRRLLAHLIIHVPRRAAAWAWSRWRRTHQHRARTSHYQRRQATYNEVLLSY